MKISGILADRVELPQHETATNGVAEKLPSGDRLVSNASTRWVQSQAACADCTQLQNE